MIRVAVTSLSFSQNNSLRDELSSLGFLARFNETGDILKGQEMQSFIGDADVLILGTESLTRDVLKGCKHLKLVSKYGVGLNNIDFEACKTFGVDVKWTPGVNKRSVSEMTLGFMLGLSRGLYRSSLALKEGQWLKQGGFQLTGKTVGIVGLGHIGRDLVSLLSSFDCQLLFNDLVEDCDFSDLNGGRWVDKDVLFSESDFVTLHVPLTDLTEGMVDHVVFDRMKSMSYLINTSRGKVVVQSDLKKALQEGMIAGAGVDVYEEEPPFDQAFLQLPSLFCTAHIGGNAYEAVLAMGRAAIFQIEKYFK